MEFKQKIYIKLITSKIFFDNLDNKIIISSMPGGYGESVIPDPIPNSEVSLSAPMVLCLKTWKSRTSPGYNKTSFNEKLYCSNWWSWFCWIKSNKTTLKKNKKKIISLDDYERIS